MKLRGSLATLGVPWMKSEADSVPRGQGEQEKEAGGSRLAGGTCNKQETYIQGLSGAAAR